MQYSFRTRKRSAFILTDYVFHNVAATAGAGVFAKIVPAYPADLPAGSQITLSLSPAAEGEVDIYDDVPSALNRKVIVGAEAGRSSYTWTIGPSSPGPGYLFAVGTVGTEYDQATLALSVAIAPLTFTTTTAPAPATQPVVATQPATVPGKGGILIAFDGTGQTAGNGTTIEDFANNYNGTKIIYEHGVAAELTNLNVPNALPGLAKAGFGGPEASVIVNNALSQLISFYGDPAHHGVPVDMIGWSRGCYEASRLASLLAAGIPDMSRPEKKTELITVGRGTQRVLRVTYPHLFHPIIRFMGLISPVNQMGPDDWLGGWPRTLPAGVKFLYEAGDDNPNDLIFLQTWIAAAAGTESFGESYLDLPGQDKYIHQHIGFVNDGVNVYRDLYKFARKVDVPI